MISLQCITHTRNVTSRDGLRIRCPCMQPCVRGCLRMEGPVCRNISHVIRPCFENLGKRAPMSSSRVSERGHRVLSGATAFFMPRRSVFRGFLSSLLFPIPPLLGDILKRLMAVFFRCPAAVASVCSFPLIRFRSMVPSLQIVACKYGSGTCIEWRE